MAKTKTLPDNPSALLTVMLRDLRQIEATPGYEVDTTIWHVPDGASCAVCMAGAVMAVSLGAPRTVTRAPGNFRGNTNKLYAIDHFRQGDCSYAFWTMSLPEPIGRRFNRTMPKYSKRNKKFHKAVAELIDDLRASGF